MQHTHGLRSRFPALGLTLAFGSVGPITPAGDDPVAAVKHCLSAVVQASDLEVGKLEVKAVGEELAVSGQSSFFGQPGTVTGSFTAGKLHSVSVTFAGGTVPVESLDRIAGGGLSSLLGAVPAVASVDLRKLRVALEADGATLESVTVGIGYGKPWDLLSGPGVRMDEVGFELTVAKPRDHGRNVTGVLSGRIAVGGNVILSLAGKLSNRPEELELTATKSGDLGSLREMLVALLPKELTAVLDAMPRPVSGCSMRDVSFSARPSARAMVLKASTELGRVVLAARADKANPSFTATFAPPQGFKLGQLDASLGSLDAAEIDLSSLALVLASSDGQLVEGIDGLAGAGTPVVKGLNLIARLDLGPLKISRVLGRQHIDLRARIPFPNPMSLVLQAAIQTEIDLGSNARFKEVVLELRPDPTRFKLGLLGKIDLQVDRQLLQMIGEMGIEPLTQTAAITMSLDPAHGEWREPFGLAGLGVEKLVASLGVTFGTAIPLPTVGLQGGLRLGAGPEPLRGAGVLVLNPRDPMHSMVALDIEKASLQRMIGLASASAATAIARSPLGAALASMEIRKVAVRIVPDDVDLAGTRFERGHRFAGEFDVLGATARGVFELDYERGVSCLATMSAIRIGRALTLTGAGRPDPTVKIDLRTDRQEFLVSGRGILLENLFGPGKHFFESAADLNVLPGGFSLSARGRVCGALDADVECSAAGSIKGPPAEFRLNARIQQSALKELHDRVVREIDNATRDHVAQINKAKKEVSDKQGEVQRWDREIAVTRRRVEERQRRDLDSMRARADADKRAAQVEYDRLGGRISAIKSQISKEPWRAVDLGAELTYLETRRNVQKVALDTIGSNLIKGLAQLGEKFPKELTSELGPMIAAQKVAQGGLHVAQGVLDGYKAVVKGTMACARWIADNGLGNVFAIQMMQFEAMLSSVRDSLVHLNFRGRFCGADFRTGMRLDVRSLDAMAKVIASSLIDGKAPDANFADITVSGRGASNLAPPPAFSSLTQQQILEKATSATAVPNRGRAGTDGPAQAPVRSQPQPQPQQDPRPPQPAAAALDLSGQWRDLNNCQIRIQQTGDRVTATMLTDSGKQHWTSASGTVAGSTIQAMRHVRGNAIAAQVDGSIQSGGTRIQWANGTTWTKTGN